MKKINKLFLTIIVAVITLFMSATAVYAAPDTIEFTTRSLSKGYIGNRDFSILNAKNIDGHAYCMDVIKLETENVTARKIASSRVNGGVVYILKNGYPNKSITGDNDKDFYITQAALWWYLDMTTGSYNVSDNIKSTGADPYNLRPYIVQLVNDGYAHRNDPMQIINPDITIRNINTNMKLENDYFISDNIVVNSSNLTSVYVTLSNAPANTKIVKQDGQEFVYKDAFQQKAGESFKVKVPSNAIANMSETIKVVASATVTSYVAYEYQPVNTDMQSTALLDKVEKKQSKEITLKIDSSRVTILKVDANTNQPLAGAKLVLKDSTGKVISSWESTTTGHVISNLANGTYTVEEESAPTGYIKSKNVTTFTITDNNKDVKVVVSNSAKKVVVNITKIDQETKKPISGAVLVVRDSTGKEVARFTSSENPYVLTNLADGTYTVEEESAPAGYIRNTDKITFIIDDNHLTHQINFINAKEVIVPDTDSYSSIIMFIIGVAITGFGLEFIYRNGQHA